MRQIKFRGLTGEGKWVYGLPIKYEYGWDITYEDSLIHVDGYEYNFRGNPVKPKTIGQFTGLHDKNGKEIYEGDLFEHKGVMYDVYWAEYKWAVRTRNVWKNNNENYYRKSIAWAISKSLVIGNIHNKQEAI